MNAFVEMCNFWVNDSFKRPLFAAGPDEAPSERRFDYRRGVKPLFQSVHITVSIHEELTEADKPRRVQTLSILH